MATFVCPNFKVGYLLEQQKVDITIEPTLFPVFINYTTILNSINYLNNLLYFSSGETITGYFLSNLSYAPSSDQGNTLVPRISFIKSNNIDERVSSSIKENTRYTGVSIFGTTYITSFIT